MQKYRTKYCEIEAVKFTAETVNELADWMGDALSSIEITPDDCCIVIHTLEGDMKASINEDYIIKGLLGEFYPCKVEAFERKYEPIDIL